MKFIDSITVHHNSEERFIELYQGDLTTLSYSEAVDILIVSVQAGSYTPFPGTLIGALDSKGVSVENLAKDKKIDIRNIFSSWISKEITSHNPQIQFKQILCFEPKINSKVTEITGDIFQSLIAFLSGSKSPKDIAMPLVATGGQGIPVSQVLPSLVEAAAHWLSLGVPIRRLKIAAYTERDAQEASEVFPELKARYEKFNQPRASEYKYDVFISYSHKNTKEANFIVSQLKKMRPNINIFIDKKELNIGSAWQQQIYDALDSCRKVIAIYSNDYLSSKICKEEFNIALYRDRDANDNVLFPIYLNSAMLPTYMKVLQYIDCREADEARLETACQQIISELDEKNTTHAEIQQLAPTTQATNNEILAAIKQLQSHFQEVNERMKRVEQKLDTLKNQ